MATALFKRVVATQPSPGIESGERIGPYRVVDRIGRGGSSAVFRGIRSDGEFEQEVAIKVLLRNTEATRSRALLERNLLGRLNHPGIARIFDAGSTPSGHPWFAMELVDGVPLDQHFERRARHWRDRIEVLLRVALAASFAHARGVVHGDLKPANILVDPEGAVKILDFGVGAFNRGSPGDSPLAGFTPGHASPEQLVGAEVGPRSDVYQLGLLIDREVLADIRYRALGSDERNQESRHGAAGEVIGQDVWVALRTIMEKATQEAPSLRYESAAQLAAALDAVLQNASRATSTSVVPPVAASPSPSRRRWHVWTRIAWALSLLVLTVVAVWGSAWRDSSVSDEHEASETRTLLDELARLERQSLEMRMEFDGDWMKRVVAVEAVAQGYRELGLYDRAARLAGATLEEALLDPASTPRERLRLELVSLEAYVHLGESVLVRRALVDASELLEQSQLPRTSSESLELLLLRFRASMNGLLPPHLALDGSELQAEFELAHEAPAHISARAWELLALDAFAKTGPSTAVVDWLDRARLTRSRHDAPWDADRLRATAILAVLGAPHDIDEALRPLFDALKDIERRQGTTADLFHLGRLLLGIALFESGDSRKLPQAVVLIAESRVALAARAGNMLADFAIAEAYGALVALKSGHPDEAASIARPVLRLARREWPEAGPFLGLLSALAQAESCATQGWQEASVPLLGAPRPAFERLLIFDVLSSCRATDASVSAVAELRSHLQSQLAEAPLSIRMRHLLDPATATQLPGNLVQ